MNIRTTTTGDFVVHMAHARYRVWRRQVETFKAIGGTRAILGHVSEDDWHQRFAANEDAFSAVVAELERVEE